MKKKRRYLLSPVGSIAVFENNIFIGKWTYEGTWRNPMRGIGNGGPISEFFEGKLHWKPISETNVFLKLL